MMLTLQLQLVRCIQYVFFVHFSPSPALKPKRNNTPTVEVLERGKIFMVEQIGNFCSINFQEQMQFNPNMSHSVENSETIDSSNDIPPGKTTMADRLQRGAAKSNEIAHRWLQDFEVQNLLRVKFLDCMLLEAEIGMQAFSPSSAPKKVKPSRTLTRTKRNIIFPKEKILLETPSSIPHKRRTHVNENFSKMSHRTSSRLRSSFIPSKRVSRQATKSFNTKPNHDIYATLDQYYEEYREDILESDKKIREVFCDGTPDQISSPSSHINQTWLNIQTSLGTYLDKVVYF